MTVNGDTVNCKMFMFLHKSKVRQTHLFTLINSQTGCLRNYCKSILQLCTSVFGRLRDLQYIFVVTYETHSTNS